MRALLVSIARQLRLSVPPAGAPAPKHAPFALGAADDEHGRRAVAGGAWQTASSLMPAPSAPGHEIDERYQALLSLVGNGPGAPIDGVLKSLIDIQQQIAKLAAAPVGSAPPAFAAGSNPAVALQAEAAQLPQPAGALARRPLRPKRHCVARRRPAGQVAAVFNAPGGPAALLPGCGQRTLPVRARCRERRIARRFLQACSRPAGSSTALSTPCCGRMWTCPAQPGARRRPTASRHRSPPPTSRSSSAPPPSATCFSPPAAQPRRSVSTSRRSASIVSASR